jgi:hypothetical protein
MDLGSGAAAQGSTPEPAPATYTPKHLADKILQSKSALEGERKQVTVLFADVKGSMDLAEVLDPEALHRVMERFFEILADGVHRFEGTINQYTGDGIMALFGAPIAHEDHAQRACLAGLALRDGLRSFANEAEATRSSSRSSCKRSWRPAISRVSRVTTAWSARSMPGTCRPRCRRCSPRASIASPSGRSACFRPRP